MAIAARRTLSLFFKAFLRPDTVELSRQTATKSDVVKGKAETDKTGINEEEMARPAGFEPAAHDLEGRCSIQLS